MPILADNHAAHRRAPFLPTIGTAAPVAETLSHPVMLVLFLLTMTQPYSLLLGPFLMGPYRLVLVLIFFPLFFAWIRGRFGGFILPDFLLLGHVFSMCLSLIVNGQADRFVEYGGAQIFDVFTAYLLGRGAIRSREDLYFFTKCFLGILLVLLPFAVLESTKGMMILQNLFRGIPNFKVFQPTTLTYPSRMGMLRAQTTINHPIVYGVLCSMPLTLALVALKYSRGGTGPITRAFWALGSAGGTFFSLSAGAFTGAFIQVLLIAYNTVLAGFPGRWKLLGAASVVVYVILDIFAGRPPLVVLSRYVAFSGATAWNRYLIWQYGTAEVGRHPIFGMGLFGDWTRAPWMSPSIDNHWLLAAMRWGLPGCALLLWAYFYILVRLIRPNLAHDPAAAAIRFAFVFTFIAVFFQMGTVILWHVTYSLLFVMLGGAVWLFNEPDKIAPLPATADGKEGTGSATRGRGRSAWAQPDKAFGRADAAAASGTAGERKIAYTRFPSQRRSDGD